MAQGTASPALEGIWEPWEGFGNIGNAQRKCQPCSGGDLGTLGGIWEPWDDTETSQSYCAGQGVTAEPPLRFAGTF